MVALAEPKLISLTQSRFTSGLTNRQRFLNAARGVPVDHPPVWMMRQAGRVLPEYRALKERYSFLELVRTPDLATEVTLQPIRRFDFDAAILFSDILVVPEALGQKYWFREAGGVQMEFALRSRQEIEALRVEDLCHRLRYVQEALTLIRPELSSRTALIGFAGSPWTLANFMLEGGSAKDPWRALDLLRTCPEDFSFLMRKLTDAVIAFLQMQVRSGVDALQIFDSHGGLLPNDLFFAGSGLWMKRIIGSINPSIPIIVFSKGTRAWNALQRTGAEVIGIDHATTLTEARRHLPPSIALQGNLDPGLLVTGDPALLQQETTRLLAEMKDRSGYIFNLGHGVPPGAHLENISAVINTVRRFA